MVDTMSAGDTMTVIRVAGVPEVLDRPIPATGAPARRHRQCPAEPCQRRLVRSADAGRSRRCRSDRLQHGDHQRRRPRRRGQPARHSRQTALSPVGISDDNVAISALATRALPGQPPQFFAQMTNYGSERRTSSSTCASTAAVHRPRLRRSGAWQLALVSQALPEGFQTLQAGITVPANSAFTDYLPEDNSAWAVSPGGGARGACSSWPRGNCFSIRCCAACPVSGVRATRLAAFRPSRSTCTSSTAGCRPRCPTPTCSSSTRRANALFTVGETTKALGNVRVHGEDPRMAFVDFKNINIAQFKQVTAGAQPLVEADGGPLLLAGDNGGRQIAILTFNLGESDLPLQITWPILMANLMSWYHPQDVVYVPDGLKVGNSLTITPPLSAEAVRVHLPDGSTRDLKVGTMIFADTQRPGCTHSTSSKAVRSTQTASFAVNLFDSNESDITPNTSIKLGEAHGRRGAEGRGRPARILAPGWLCSAC